MRRVVVFLALFLVSLSAFSLAQSADSLLTPEEKTWGLMTVWGEVKYNFVFPERLKDWDDKVRGAFAEVDTAQDVAAYYNTLKRLVASLNNGHTAVYAPDSYWQYFNMPAIEIQVIDSRFFISRVGKRADLLAQNLVPGLEITAVDGEPALQHFENKILPLFSFSRRQTAEARYAMWLLAGKRDSPVRLRVSDVVGNQREVNLERTTKQDDGEFFLRKAEDPFRHNLENKLIDGVLYIDLATFALEASTLAEKFDQILAKHGSAKPRGLILDLRFNGGGNDEAAFAIASRLLTKPTPGAKSRIRKYVPAHRAWGYSEEWEYLLPNIVEPVADSGRRFTGPVVLLIGPETASAAEDFVMVMRSGGRATLVGERSAGDTGQILSFDLPGGGLLWVCTKEDFFADGTKLLGEGIGPDIEVHLTREDLTTGNDRTLARAVEVFRASTNK